MIHDLTITLNEQTLPFLPAGDPHMIWTHRVDHASFICQASLVVMPSHLGTHVDAPLHYVKGGKTTADVELSRFCGKAVCLAADDFPREGEYDIKPLLERNAASVEAGDILILYTGYEKLVGTPEYFKFPNFAENTGEALEARGLRGIGFDSPSISLGNNRAHQEVLGREIAIIESLVNLESLVGRRFFFIALPLKFEDGDGSPVRAVAITED
ncbi:MAG: cyclase family protein [Clostridiales Family XIII bacterium]|jgi:kynurenine formamidase|nr:cyclase family protein [Clostridiales Family XIII bacterium]